MDNDEGREANNSGSGADAPPPYPPGGPPPYAPGGPPSFNPVLPPSWPQKGFYPLDFNRIMEMTFSLVRFRYRTMLAASLIVLLPVAILFGASTLITAQENAEWVDAVGRFSRGDPFDVLASYPWGTLLLGLLVGAIVALGGFVATAAVSYIAAATFEGRAMTAGEAVRKALGRFSALTGAYLVTFLVSAGIIILGMVVAVPLFTMSSAGGQLTPGPVVFLGIVAIVAAFALIVFLTVRWSLLVPTTVTESTGATESLRRSWKLVSGSTWRVIGFLIVVGLTVGMVAFVLGMLITLATGAVSLSITQTATTVDPSRLALANFLTMLVAAALTPFSAVATLLLYFDLRWRAGEKVPTPGSAAAPSVPEQES
jgi:hypothetical protein